MPTDNHGLNTPSEGATDWHIPLNENFNSLDAILKNISADGTTHSPSALVADEITLGGDTRASWPNGSGGTGRETTYMVYENGGTYYAESATFPNHSGSEAADVIQAAADALDGTKTGYDDGRKADRPGGGDIHLARGNYVLNSTVTLRKGVALVGAQPTFLLGRNNHEFEYCVLSAGSGLANGTPMIQTEPGQDHIVVRNLAINGADRSVYGIKLQDGSSTSMVSNVHIARTRLPGYWTRGSLDTWVHMTSVKDCGDDSNPAVLIESANDSIGSPSNDTQIRWYGGRISGGGEGGALRFNSSLGRWYDTTLKLPPNVNPSSLTPSVIHEGNFLELSRCTVDAYRVSNTVGIRNGAGGNANHLRVSDTLVEKADYGIYLDGNTDTTLRDVRVRDTTSAGIYVNHRSGHWDSVDIQGVQEAGVVVDGAQPSSIWEGLRINGWDKSGGGHPAIDIQSVKGGQPGDVPVINGLDLGNLSATDYAAHINNPHLCIVDGEWVRPHTYSLGGTSGSLSISDRPANPTAIRVDAGSAAANLQGIDGRTGSGNVVVVERTGSNDVVLEHDNGSAAHPLLNRSGANETLASAGSVAAYRFDSQSGAWRQVWSNTA